MPGRKPPAVRTVPGVVEPPKLPRRLAYVPLGKIAPAERNPKQHDLQSLRESLLRFSFAEMPLVDERTGRLVAGHGRIEALVSLRQHGQQPPGGVLVDDDGEWLVPIIRGWASRNDIEAEAYLVGSNYTSEAGGWHRRNLAELLEDFATEDATLLDAIGVTADSLDELLRSVEPSQQPPDGPVDLSPDDTPTASPEGDGEPPTAVACPGCGLVIPLHV